MVLRRQNTLWHFTGSVGSKHFVYGAMLSIIGSLLTYVGLQSGIITAIARHGAGLMLLMIALLKIFLLVFIVMYGTAKTYPLVTHGILLYGGVLCVAWGVVFLRILHLVV